MTATRYRHDRNHPRVLLEARAPFELGGFIALGPLLRMARRGDGAPVLVLPGLAAGDTSTAPLRRYLADLGHRVHGWRLGQNEGPTERIVEGLLDRVEELHERYDTPLMLVGWSLGGAYSAALGRVAPHVVRRVVTLGSPLAALDDPSARTPKVLRSLAARRFGPASGPQTPLTSIWSRTDAIVPWAASRVVPGDRAENVEVIASHLGLGVNSAAAFAIADRLSRPARTLPGFRPPRPIRHWYPDPDRP